MGREAKTWVGRRYVGSGVGVLEVGVHLKARVKRRPRGKLMMEGEGEGVRVLR